MANLTGIGHVIDPGVNEMDQRDGTNVVSELRWLSRPMQGFCEADLLPRTV